MAECPSCGKSYQAPDSMAGKQVRCKQCQTVFRIEAPPANESDELDLDALAQSFGGDHFGDADETAAGGPTLDAHGRPSIGRRSDVSDVAVQGYNDGSGLRANLRYRYPFARQVDVGLPWLMVVLAIVVPLQLCLTTKAEFDEPLTSGVGASRFFVLLIAFLAIVFPLTHVMVARASRELRFNMPRTPVWRSLACASAVLLLGGSLFVLSGGTLGGVITGIVVGVATCVALVTLLFRLLPHEVGKTAAYAAIGSGGGAALAALLIFGINVAGSRAAAAQAEPTLFVSPIAVGLPWVDRPAAVPVKVTPKPKPVRPTTPSTDAVVATAPPSKAPPTPDLPPLSALVNIPLPPPPDGFPQLLKSLAIPPVLPGFQELIVPLAQSHALGVIREVEGKTQVQCWDVNTWYLPTTAGRNFERSQGELFVNTAGDRIVRIVSSPFMRIEQIPLGRAIPMQPVKLDDKRSMLEGFINDHDVIVRAHDADGAMLFERRDLNNEGNKSAESQPPRFQSDTTEKCVFVPASKGRSIRFAPDGSGVLLAGNVEGKPGWKLAFYALDKYAVPAASRTVNWDSGDFEPTGLAMNAAGRVALLLNASGEANLTLYQMRDLPVDGTPMTASSGAVEVLGLGSFESIRATSWDFDSEPLCWLDADTLLLYGRVVVDARTGQKLGEVALPFVRSVLSLGDDKVLVTHAENGNNALWVVEFDRAQLDAARKQP